MTPPKRLFPVTLARHGRQQLGLLSFYLLPPVAPGFRSEISAARFPRLWLMAARVSRSLGSDSSLCTSVSPGAVIIHQPFCPKIAYKICPRNKEKYPRSSWRRGGTSVPGKPWRKQLHRGIFSRVCGWGVTGWWRTPREKGSARCSWTNTAPQRPACTRHQLWIQQD